MKWTEFRELTPEQRRSRRRSRSHGIRARQEFIKKATSRLPRGDFEKYPESRHIGFLIHSYVVSKTPEEIKAWLNMKVDIFGRNDGWQRLAPFELLLLGKEHPDLIFGFFTKDHEFVPGLIALMAYKFGIKDLYTDPLDEILSEENLSGMIIDEVVAMAGQRGMTEGNNNDVVRQRVRIWENDKPKKS